MKKKYLNTILFGMIWVLSLGIVIIASIMIETNMSFAKDPDKVVSISVSSEEDIIYEYNDLYVLFEDKLPKNIKTFRINNMFYGEKEISSNETFEIDMNKTYKFRSSFYVEYDLKAIWIRAALNTTALILITFGVISFRLNKRRDEDEQYLKALDEIRKSSEVYRPVLWQVYADKVNLKRKIKQWKSYCMIKENNLDSKATEYDLRLWKLGTLEQKLNNEYCYKKLELREFQGDQWINDNIEFKLIKYDKITYKLIYVGHDTRNRVENPNDFVVKGKKFKILIDNLPRLLIGMGISAALSAIVFDLNKFSIQVLFTMFLSIINIAWNTFLSTNYADNFFNNVSLGDVEFRKSTAQEYSDFIKSIPNTPEEPVIEVSKIKEENHETTNSTGTIEVNTQAHHEDGTETN